MNKKSTLEFCEGYIMANNIKNKFWKDGGIKAMHILESVHNYISGPMKRPMLGAARYSRLFIEDFTK